MARLTGGQRALKAFVQQKPNRSQFEVKSIITATELLTKETTRASFKRCIIDPITGEKTCTVVYAKVAKK